MSKWVDGQEDCLNSEGSRRAWYSFEFSAAVPETTPGISLLLVPGAHTRYQNIGSRGAVASHCLGPHFNGSGMRVSYIFYPQQEVISCLQNGASQGKA